MQPATRLWDHLRSNPETSDGWRPLTKGLAEVERMIGVSQGYASTTLRGWEQKGLVEIHKAGNQGRTSPVDAVRFKEDVRPNGESKPKPDTVPMAGSTKEQVLAYLRDHISERGYLQVSNDKARRALHLSAHDFNKYIFDLKEMGLVSFNVSGQGANMTIRKIRVRPAGLVKTIELDRGKWPGAPKGAFESDEGWLVIGNQAFTLAEWQGNPGKVFRKDHAKVSQPVSDQIEESVMFTEPPAPEDIGLRIRQKYPLITEMLERTVKHSHAWDAIKLLREAGMNAEADLVEEAIEPLTPFEQEVIQLMEDYTHANP